MTKEEVDVLRIEGQRYLMEILGDLNKASEHIRVDKDECYRRMEDAYEMQVALALFLRKRKIEPTVV